MKEKDKLLFWWDADGNCRFCKEKPFRGICKCDFDEKMKDFKESIIQEESYLKIPFNAQVVKVYKFVCTLCENEMKIDIKFDNSTCPHCNKLVKMSFFAKIRNCLKQINVNAYENIYVDEFKKDLSNTKLFYFEEL